MYLALYRKYRPQTFDDVISQEHITTTLKNQLKSGQTAHAYLFTGSRGTGKTTCAKILAKAINCLNPIDGNPCLECECCRAVDEDASDVTEIDAASNTGVDSVRDIKDEAMYAPIVCKKRVYIIDEVHMLSIQAFNALLKLIEEPPPHVVFIFATTEIHKVPATILSRCQRFEFRRIDINDSKKRLLEIAEKEGMELDEDAAYLISRISDGGMRDALSLLDQCFSIGGRVTEETVRACAGISGTEHIFAIADAALEHNSSAALEILDGLIQRSKSPVRLIEELISHYRTLMLLKAGANRNMLRMTGDEERQYKRQADEYTLEMIMRALSILSDTFAGMGRSRNEALSCEMCLIKLCTPKLDTDEKALSGRIDALEKLVNDALNGLVQPKRAVEKKTAEVVPERAVEQSVTASPPQKAAKIEEAPAETVNEKAAVQAEQPMKIDLPFDLDEPNVTNEPPPELEHEAVFDIPVPMEYSEPVQDEPFAAEPYPAEPPDLNAALGLEPPPPPTASVAKKAEIPEKPITAIKAVKKEAAPSGYEPFKEWQEIVNNLPFSIRILISDTTAMISGSTVLVCGSELQKGYAVDEFAVEIREAVSRAIGRNVTLTKQEQVPKRDENDERLTSFLDLARSQGVSIKEQ